MNGHLDEQSLAPQLSSFRTFLFGALAFVWFSEMMLWGVPFLSKMWTHVWKIVPSENPQLATALSLIQALEAPAKGALGVMAVFGLRSKNPSARTALFLSMALVPPLNMAFPFREQGFPFGSMAVATAFSIILWGSFYLFRERARHLDVSGRKGSDQWPPSRWEILQYTWFAANSAALTVMALLILFAPRNALNLVFPSLSPLLNTSQGELSSLIRSTLASGTHLLALATASWIATAYCRSNPTLRHAVTIASTVHAGLMCLFPLRQIIEEVGERSATSSILIAFVPLFVCWVLYAVADTRRTRFSTGSRSRSSLPVHSLEGTP